MDQREARKYVTANPPPDPPTERRPSLLGRLLFRRTSSLSEDGSMMTAGMERRGSIEATETTTSITQKVQQQMVNAPRKSSNAAEANIFT